MKHWPVLAFGSGLVGSLLGTRLIEEIGWHHRYHAVVLEFLTIAMGIIGWQIWADQKNNWKVLAVEGLGTILGTWVILS